MANRLTDEELADVTARVADGRCAVCMGGPNCERCFQCRGTGAFSLSTHAVELMLAELRERRAADITAEDRAGLQTLHAFVYREVAMTQAECDALKPGLDVLDKLLGQVKP